jgi:hypothetical protein
MSSGSPSLPDREVRANNGDACAQIFSKIYCFLHAAFPARIAGRKSTGPDRLDCRCQRNQPPALARATFFAERSGYSGSISLSPDAPLTGIEAAGWRLTYTDQPNEVIKTRAKREKQTDERYSIGLLVKEDGTIIDVLAGTPADTANLAPGMKVVAVNSRTYNPERSEEAIESSAQAGGLDLLVNSSDYYETSHLNYRGGLRYPHLERDSAKPDLLSQILRPRQSGN